MCKKSEQKISTKLLELMPVIKREKESSDVEEVAVSPEKKRRKNDAASGRTNGTVRSDNLYFSKFFKLPPQISVFPLFTPIFDKN